MKDDGDPAELDAAQVADLRQRLEERKASLIAAIDERRGQEREQQGREVGDEMDEASLEGSTSMTSKLLERDAHILAEINHALAKMGDGSYGFCEGSGEPIGYARLSLRPWARFSIEHQEELERHQRARGG